MRPDDPDFDFSPRSCAAVVEYDQHDGYRLARQTETIVHALLSQAENLLGH
jgi:hypothetical protein